MKRVLIVRLSAMGDILHAMPAVTALRRSSPEVEVGWLVEERWQPLLHSALVDHLHLAQFSLWRKSWLSGETRHGIKKLADEMRAVGYDAVVDFQGAIRSAFLARASGAVEIVGEDAPREWIARYLFTKRVKTRGVHVIEQDLEVMSGAAGVQLDYTPAMLPHDAETAEWARSQREAARPLVLMNPGAGWGAKQWPAERYGFVAKALFGLGCQVLVNAGPAERELADDVVRASENTARAVECSIEQLIELTRASALFMGGDTGPLHLASALGVPCVAIFGPTDPARNGPYGTSAVVLRSPKSKRDHSRHKRPEKGLLTISPGEVIAAARNLLGAQI